MGNFMDLINLKNKKIKEPLEDYLDKEEEEKENEKNRKLNNIIIALKKINILINVIINIKNKMLEEEERIKDKFYGVQDLTVKEIFAIFFLWMVLFLNLSIFLKGDFLELFFPNISLMLLGLVIFLCVSLVVIETWNIIKRDKCTFHNIIPYFYLVVLLLIVFKSILYSKGFNWQFYLIIVVINLNLIIFPRFNIIDMRELNITPRSKDQKKKKE